MPDATIQEIREILKEVSELQKETEKRFRETDVKFKETEAQFKQMKREMAERDKVTEKRINKAFDLFETQWGKGNRNRSMEAIENR